MTELKGFGKDFKSAEEVLRLTRFTVDNAADAVYWMDSKARIVDVNDAACSTLGYTREELLNLTVFDIDPDFTTDKWKEAWEALKSQGKLTLETVHRTKEGRIIPVEIMANYLNFGGRELDCAFARDITERKQAMEKVLHRASLLKGINRVLQAALTSESEEDLGRTCLSIAEDVTGSKFGFIGEIGTDGLLHDTAISDIGWELCTMYDKTGHRRAPGDFRIHGIYGRVLLESKGFFTNDPASHTDSIGTPQGHPVLEAFLGVPLIQGGKTIGMIALGNREGGYRHEELELLEALAPAVVEAFHRKRSEEALVKLSKTMAVRNLELEMLNKELAAFTHSASHDLREPLRIMGGFARIVAEKYADKLDLEGRNYLARIRSNAERMSQLIEDLLRLSQISRQEIVKINYDLSNLAASIMSALHQAEPDRNVEVVIESGLRANVDSNLMRIALSNLLTNAWKFTSKVDESRIEFGATDQDGQYVYFVRDNGAGFDQAFADKMFLPFERLHSDKEFEGTGIGLSIAERIIHRHGGRIWAEGAVGKGATFYFMLE